MNNRKGLQMLTQLLLKIFQINLHLALRENHGNIGPMWFYFACFFFNSLQKKTFQVQWYSHATKVCKRKMLNNNAFFLFFSLYFLFLNFCEKFSFTKQIGFTPGQNTVAGIFSVTAL